MRKKVDPYTPIFSLNDIERIATWYLDRVAGLPQRYSLGLLRAFKREELKRRKGAL
ncbi:MAG: hypothetical protein Q8O19_06470 [Rectinemataceae bacterium]|nr:hypothetical protein [Rectinemataceae bacterium]